MLLYMRQVESSISTKGNKIFNINFTPSGFELSAALSFTTPSSMPQEFGRNWVMKVLNGVP